VSITRVVPVLSGRQVVVLVVVGTFLLAATCSLVFGPARGARDDIGQVRTDLHASRQDVHQTLGTARRTLTRLTDTLGLVQDSLRLQQQGLDIAQESQDVARTGVDATLDIRRQTTDTLATLRRVITALGPLQELRGDLATVVDSVEAGVALARSTLAIAQQTLTTGQEALRIAGRTLATLEESRDLQVALLDVARQTLRQATEINRKIPVPPIFPTTAR
jgi:hypothetical protein